MTFQLLLWMLGKRINWLAENDSGFKQAWFMSISDYFAPELS